MRRERSADSRSFVVEVLVLVALDVGEEVAEAFEAAEAEGAEAVGVGDVLEVIISLQKLPLTVVYIRCTVLYSGIENMFTLSPSTVQYSALLYPVVPVRSPLGEKKISLLFDWVRRQGRILAPRGNVVPTFLADRSQAFFLELNSGSLHTQKKECN